MALELSTLPKQDLPPTPTLPPLPKLPTLPRFEDLNRQSQQQMPAVPNTPTTKDTPVEEAKHQDNFGWITNLPESMFRQVKSIAYDLPKAVLTSAIHYAKDPAQYNQDLTLLFQKNNGLGQTLKEGITDYYTKDFWHNFNEDPARLLGDAAAVISLGAGGAKALASTAGRVGAGVGTPLARTAGEMALLERTASVGRVAHTVGEVSNYLDPVMLAGKAAGKLASPILESLGFSKWSPEINAIRAQLAAGQSIEMNTELTKTIFGKLTPEENERLLRLIRWGDRGEIELAEQTNDLVSKRFKIWQHTITGGDEPLFKQLHLLDDKQAREANAVKMSEYSHTKYKELGLEKPVTPKESLHMMDAQTHNPTFMSSYRLKAQSQDLFEAMNKATYRGGFWSRFEKAVGGRQLETDVDTIMARQIAAKHDALLKLKTADAIKALMEERGEGIWVGRGQEHVVIPNTHAPLQDAYFKKYWSDMERGSSHIAQHLTSVENPITSLAMAQKAIQENPEIIRAVASEGEYYVPKGVAAWLNRELAPISPLGRMYDSALARFKGLATVMNPRFWGSVIFGNSVLGMLYGISPDYARVAYKYREFLPPELRQVMRAEVFLRDKGIYSRVSNSLGDFAQQLDNMFRLPIFAQEVAKASYERMKGSGQTFFMTTPQIIEAVKFYGQAPQKLMDTRLAIESLKKEFASGRVDIIKQEHELQGLEREVSKAEALVKSEAIKPGPKWDPKKPIGSVTIDPMTGETISKEVNKDWWELTGQGHFPQSEGQSKAVALANKYGNAEEALKALKEDSIHKLAEIGQLQQKIPHLLQDAMIADKAIDAGNRFYGSYARLSPFERKTLRRLLPFYTFNKAMTSLAFRFPFLYPKRAFIGSHLAQAWNDITSDENSFMPPYMRNYLPVAARPDGSIVAISAGMLNPFGSVRMGHIAETPIPSVFNPLQSHPVISLLLKMNGAIPEWSGKPLSPGDYSTRLDNGVVQQWTGKGFKTVIAQPSIFQSLAQLFPQAQLIDKAVHRYAQSDRGWLFNPDPILGPDGQPRYPKELMDVMLGMVIPTQSYDREQMKAAEQRKMSLVIKSYINDLKYATPVRREQILEILRGWQDEKNRKWVE